MYKCHIGNSYSFLNFIIARVSSQMIC